MVVTGQIHTCIFVTVRFWPLGNRGTLLIYRLTTSSGLPNGKWYLELNVDITLLLLIHYLLGGALLVTAPTLAFAASLAAHLESAVGRCRGSNGPAYETASKSTLIINTWGGS